MNNLADVCLVRLWVGGNYKRCLVVVIRSMGLGGTKRCGGAFKVVNLRGMGEGGNPQRTDQFLLGELTTLYTMKGLLTM